MRILCIPDTQCKPDVSMEHLTWAGKAIVDYKPDVLLKFCADGGVGIGEVEWTQWTKDGAEGTGKYVANDCDPSCVDGKIFTKEVYVKLSKLKTISGKEAFTYVQVESKDKKPLPLLDSMDDEWSMEMAG